MKRLPAWIQRVFFTLKYIMNSYELSRKFINWAFENPSKIKPNHYALYFFSIEHCNRLGWKKEFGLPSTMAMEATGIKSHNTYMNTFNDLIDFGFINCIERSKNQYSSNIVALSNFNKALDKALDKALIKHSTKQSESTIQSIDSINKPITIKPITIKPITIIEDKRKEELFRDWLTYRKQINKEIKAERTVETLAKRFNEESLERISFVINNSIENNWQGLFWDKAAHLKQPSKEVKKEFIPHWNADIGVDGFTKDKQKK